MALSAVGSAIVDLDEIKSYFFEKKVAILLLMPKQSHTTGYRVVVPEVAAGVGAGIAVYSGFQAERVYVVNDRLETAGKSGRVEQQTSRRFVTASEISVVDIDIAVAYRVKTELDESVGLFHYKRVGDVYTIRVPRAPSHGGCVVGVNAYGSRSCER